MNLTGKKLRVPVFDTIAARATRLEPEPERSIPIAPAFAETARCARPAKNCHARNSRSHEVRKREAIQRIHRHGEQTESRGSSDILWIELELALLAMISLIAISIASRSAMFVAAITAAIGIRQKSWYKAN
jgi:hypothetical protein